jgi:hypothetical protein
MRGRSSGPARSARIVSTGSLCAASCVALVITCLLLFRSDGTSASGVRSPAITPRWPFCTTRLLGEGLCSKGGVLPLLRGGSDVGSRDGVLESVSAGGSATDAAAQKAQDPMSVASQNATGREADVPVKMQDGAEAEPEATVQDWTVEAGEGEMEEVDESADALDREEMRAPYYDGVRVKCLFVQEDT